MIHPTAEPQTGMPARQTVRQNGCWSRNKAIIDKNLPYVEWSRKHRARRIIAGGTGYDACLGQIFANLWKNCGALAFRLVDTKSSLR